MVERVTQRANFGNLRPQARPVDTFRRQDTRDLDNFIEFANQRLKATQGIIDAGFGAYQTYRESKKEEVAFKAQADAVKGTVDPELQGSWAIYGKQQKRTKGLLKAREKGNEIINDNDFLADVFNETDKINDLDKKGINYASMVTGVRSAFLTKNENNEYGSEQVYKLRIDNKIKDIIKDNPDIDVEELLRYKGQLDQTFFETVRKNEVNNRVATFREVVRTTLFDKTSPAYQGLFRLYSDDDKATPVGFNKNFYNILGTLTDQGMAEGLTREQSVNVALKEIIGVAYTFDNANSNSGRIIDEEEKLYITNIIGALQDKVTDSRVLKSGSMLMDNNQYREFIFENIEKLDLMLENGEKEDEANAKKTAKQEMNKWMLDTIFDIKYPKDRKEGIETIEQLQTKLQEGANSSWSQYYDLNTNVLTNLFNTQKTQGGVGDTAQYREAIRHAHFGTNGITPGEYLKDASFLLKKYPKLNATQEREVVRQMMSSISDKSSSRIYAKRWSDKLSDMLVGNTAMFEALIKTNKGLRNTYDKLFDDYRVKAEIIERDFKNVGADVKSEQYEKLFKELEEGMDGMLKTYFENEKAQTVIDVDNLETLPDWLTEKDEETGLPETLYMAYFLERKPQLFQDAFPEMDQTPFTKLFAKSKARARNNPDLTEDQAVKDDFEYLQLIAFGVIPDAKTKPELSYSKWEEKLYEKKGIGVFNSLNRSALDIIKNILVELLPQEPMFQPR